MRYSADKSMSHILRICHIKHSCSTNSHSMKTGVIAFQYCSQTLLLMIHCKVYMAHCNSAFARMLEVLDAKITSIHHVLMDITRHELKRMRDSRMSRLSPARRFQTQYTKEEWIVSSTQPISLYYDKLENWLVKTKTQQHQCFQSSS